MSRDTSEDTLPESSPVEPRPRRGVLIVDDDEAERRLLATGLEDHGFQAWSVATGYEAVKLYPRLRDQLSAIVLDLNMPGLDGTDTLNLLRSIDPELRIYILTGHVGIYDEHDLLRTGAARVLYKPIALKDLAGILRDREGTRQAAP